MTGLLNSNFYRPPFSPTQLANLFAWFDASDAATITESSGAVSQWSDKSGNARHVTQSTAGAKPTYSATGLAGTQPGITFDGGDKLENTTFTLASGTLIHAFVVMRPTGSTSYARVISFVGASGADFQSNGYIPVLRNASGNNWYAYSNGEGSANVSVPANNTAVVGSVRTNSSNYFLSKNGTETSTVALGFPSATMTSLGIGARADTPSSDSFSGTISEIILLAGATPTSDERAAIQTYLAAKWTLT